MHYTSIQSGFLSGWQDLNLRPPRPERGTLPNWATSRYEANRRQRLTSGDGSYFTPLYFYCQVQTVHTGYYRVAIISAHPRKMDICLICPARFELSFIAHWTIHPSVHFNLDTAEILPSLRWNQAFRRLNIFSLRKARKIQNNVP